MPTCLITGCLDNVIPFGILPLGITVNTPTHLLDQALELFAARGYDAVGVQEIALASGVTKPTLYHHFGSKQGVLEALIRRDAGPLLAGLEAATVYQNDLTLNLRRVAEAYLRFATGQPSFYRLLVSCSLAPPESKAYRAGRAVHDRQRGLVEAMFEHAASDHGNMRGRARRYAHSFVGLVNIYLTLVLAGEVEVGDRLVHDIVHQFSHGIYS